MKDLIKYKGGHYEIETVSCTARNVMYKVITLYKSAMQSKFLSADRSKGLFLGDKSDKEYNEEIAKILKEAVDQAKDFIDKMEEVHSE